MKTLLCCALVLVSIFSGINAQNFLAACVTESASSNSYTDACSSEVTPLHPFSVVRTKLEQLSWCPESINSAVREYWGTDMNFLVYHMNAQSENITGLSTSCHHTAPWILSTLFELQTMPYIRHGLYQIPENHDLIVYNNVAHPRSTLPTPPVQNIRDFINSRPQDESIILQVDICQLLPPDSHYYNDHHFMIHAYNGSINLYHSWQDHFTLIDWMTDAGSFEARYPMAQDTFLDYFERIFAPVVGEDEIKEKQEAIWALLGRTGTLTWECQGDGREGVDDVVVRLLHDTWLVLLVTHFPSK